MSPFLPTLLVLSLLVNSSFSIICISTPILQLVPSLTGAPLFLLPCHCPTFQLLSSSLSSVCTHQFLPLALFLSLEHLFSPGTSSFSAVLFPSHVLGWSASLFAFSLLSVTLVDVFFPSLTLLRGSRGLLSAAEVSVVTSWIQWNTFLPCCRFSLYLFMSALLPKHCHATVSFSTSYGISKLHCRLSVSFSTPMILQSKLLTYI